MSLTKKQKQQLENVLYDMQRAYNYIQKSSGIAVEITEKQTNGATYRINNPQCALIGFHTPKLPSDVVLTDKGIGSDIAGLGMALNNLKLFLEE